MPTRPRRSPMDRAADGLERTGEALGLLYEAARQGLPEVLARVDRALILAERAVRLAEREQLLPHCGYCGQLVSLHDQGRPCGAPLAT
jgi:hypothetical protein